MHPVRCAGLLALLMVCGAWLGAARAADTWSQSNVRQFRARHIELALSVDFASQQLVGTAALEFERLDPHASQLILDTSDLTILGVSEQTTDILGATGKIAPLWISRPFHLARPDPILGSALVIDLPQSASSQLLLRIDYETSPRSRALRWRLPVGAARRQRPLLYSVSAPINARSWIPLQDSPQARFTWRAHINVDDGLAVVMPGAPLPAAGKGGASGFVMDQPVPPAALALVVGDLRARSSGARTVVRAEGSAAAAAARALGDAEPLLQAGERLLGRYPWGAFEIVVMPAAFPVADMDYPGVALISPTLLAGPHAQPEPLAAALAQAWIGTQLSGPDWRDRWIGEAIASYFAARMLATLPGATPAAEPIAAAAGDGQLASDLQGVGFDDIFNAVPRYKGRLFFEWLAQRVGAPRIDELLRRFLDHPAAEEVTTDGLMSFLEKHLVDGKPGSPTREQLDDWVYGYAMPNEAAPVPASDATTGPVDAAHLAGTERFLLSTGRLDLLEPRYLELAASGSGLDAARRIFALSRAALDPFVARRLEQIVRP